MYLGIINEVLRDHRICMLPTAFSAVRKLVLQNIDSRAQSIHIEKQPVCERIMLNGSPSQAPVPDASASASIPTPDASPRATLRGSSPDPQSSPDSSADNHGYISLIHLQGPMTRGGGECSYGSREIRDFIIDGALDPDCRGHIILTDTPGGMCSCLPDFRMAINCAHEHGQQVVMLIDGIAASCGAFVGAMCDGIYYTNPKDEIGSIGMYAAFFTLADGAENKITSEVYHEYYAKASVDKNAWQRQAAAGDSKQLQAEIDHDLDLLIADLSADRPSIIDEQKTGKMYPVADVVGSLVDGQSSIDELCNMLIADYNERQGAPLPIKPGASPSSSAEPTPAPDPSSLATLQGSSPAPPDPSSLATLQGSSPASPNPSSLATLQGSSPAPASPQAAVLGCPPSHPSEAKLGAAPSSPAPNPNKPMKQYPTISAALQMGEAIMESDTENLLTLQPEEADALEAVLNVRNAQVADLQSQIASLQQQLCDVRNQSETAATTAAEQLAAAQQAQQAAEQQLAEVQQQLAAAQHEATEAAQAHQTAIDAVNAALSAAQQTVADNQQTIADLRSENERLASGQGNPIKAGAEPQSDANPLPTGGRILSKEETEALVRAQYGNQP